MSSIPIKIKAMRIWLVSTLLFACSLGWAAPKHQPAQDIEQFLADAGVINQMEQLRQNMSDTASGLVVNAMGLLGVPYRAGGMSEKTGFDCSGFVRTIFERSIGLVLPRRAKDQAEVTQNIQVEDLKPGDLVFYHTLRQAFSHVGIYIGDGKFIHSPRPGHQVRIEDMREAYWAKRFDGARRVKELNPNSVSETNAITLSNMSAVPSLPNSALLASTSASSKPLLGSAYAATLPTLGAVAPLGAASAGPLSNLLPLSLPSLSLPGSIGNVLPNFLGFKSSSSNSGINAPPPATGLNSESN